MLRTACTNLTRNTPAWRSLSTARPFTTATPPSSDKETKRPLSERLGAGRGKALESSASDPFNSFLASAKKNRGPNNRRNGNFTPRNKRNDNNKTAAAAQPGQFDDAEKKVAAAGEGQPVKKRNNNNNNNNNNRNNNNRNRKNKEQQQAKEAEGGEQRQQPRRKNMRRKTQPDEVRTRRATAFIDKDIDWASFDTAEAEVTVEVKDGEQESNELLLKDIQGDYDRYLAVGSDVNWGKAIDSNSVSTLIGSNATFDYQQKTAFLAALSNATGGAAAAAARK